MTTMTIRRIDNELKQRLRVQAAQHGRSMEDEARDILRSALSTEAAHQISLAESIRAKVEPLGGVDLPIPPRDAIRKPPNLSE